MENFNDKVVVITGGATGIGFAFAKALGQEGAKIVISGLREDRLKEAVSKLEALNVEAKFFLGDATKMEDTEALADFAWNAYGKVDVLFNNAGVMIPPSTIIDMPLEHLHHLFNINFFGVIIGSQVFGKRFIAQGTPAAIFNLGSENSFFHGVPLGGPYVASKHGVLAITQSLHEETPDFIDVGLICPGFVVSEIGAEENMQHGMPTDDFVQIALKQIKAGEFFIVSHSYNLVHIEQKHKQISEAYAKYAPPQEGDIKYDVRTLFTPIVEEMLNRKLKPLF